MSPHSKSRLVKPAQNSNDPPATVPRGAFVIYLCVIPAPLAVRQPQARAFRPFRFFITRAVIGSRERFLLTMGFFATRAHADRWLRLVRSTHSNACVSRVSGPPAAPPPAAKTLPDSEVLRVLESRPPKSDGEVRETGASNSSYIVRSQEAVLARPGARPAVAPPGSRVEPQAKPVDRAAVASRLSAPKPPAQNPPVQKPPPPKPPPQKEARKPDALDDALEALARRALRLRNDTTSANGVRHLHVEFMRKPKRPTKPPGPRKS